MARTTQMRIVVAAAAALLLTLAVPGSVAGADSVAWSTAVLSSQTVGATADYAIAFATSANGALAGG